MKYIISIRAKSTDPLKREQFITGSAGTVQTKIINMINRDPGGNYDFLINDDGSKYTKNVKDLCGEVINIVNDDVIADFTEDDNGDPLILMSHFEGALPQQHTVDQLNMVRKASKSTDIGDRISDMNKQGANLQYMRNPIDTGIESTQDYERSSKKFQPNWNLKRLKPFKDYALDQPTSHIKKKAKK